MARRLVHALPGRAPRHDAKPLLQVARPLPQPLRDLLRLVHGPVIERGTVAQKSPVGVRLEHVHDRHRDEVAEVEVRVGGSVRVHVSPLLPRLPSLVRRDGEDARGGELVHPPPHDAVRAGDPVPPPRDPHHREAGRVDDICVISLRHEGEPPEEKLRQAHCPGGRLELDSRDALYAKELGGREGLGQYHLSVGGENLQGQRGYELVLILELGGRRVFRVRRLRARGVVFLLVRRSALLLKLVVERFYPVPATCQFSVLPAVGPGRVETPIDLGLPVHRLREQLGVAEQVQ
mmetsp:Transcript_2950/g.6180  ORF Transcript_2950/g.6180 Transcript_2950/m.6180 type:complete len:291 (+) Transcript_2950:410-1282(+)